MQQFYNFFLFRYQHKDFIEFSQARLTLNFCLITSLFSVIYAISANLIDFEISVLVMSVLSIVFIGIALLLRSSVSLKAIAFLYLTLSYFSSVILIYFSGLIYSSITPWLAFIPFTANLLINRKAAFFWFGICFITVLGLAYGQDTYSNVPVHYNKEYEVIFYAIVYNGLSAIILSLSMVFQQTKENVLSTLNHKNKLISSINSELQNKNQEIIAQNSELTQQKEEITAQREFIEIKNRELLLIQDDLNTLIEKLTATQDSLAYQEAENRSILDAVYNAQLVVGELDLHGTFTKISSEITKLLKTSEKEILGKTFEEIGGEIWSSADTKIDLDQFWKQLTDGNTINQEAMVVIKNDEFWLKSIFFPVQNKSGALDKIMIVAQDISQIKQQQNEIEVLNIDLKENLWKIETQNELLHTQQKEIESINKELKQSNDEIKSINLSLENRVKERTNFLELQNKQLKEYAYINAHLLRGPLCSILGLVQLMEMEDEGVKNPLVNHMKKSSGELREIVDKISKAIEKGTYFDRNLI